MRLLFCYAVSCLIAFSQVSVLTARGDNTRTSQNTSEVNLTPTLVSSSRFGLFGQYKTPDGNPVLGQPLIVSGVTVAGQVTTLLIAGTMGATSGTTGDNLYAFDSTLVGSAALWSVNLGTPWSNNGYSSQFYSHAMGILSTPVVDKANGWVFVVSYSGGSSSTPTIYLNKVRLTDGVLLTQVQMTNSILVPGAGCNANSSCTGGAVDTTSGGNLLFNPLWENQRSPLMISGGNVYVPFGAGNEPFAWHGWIVEYDEATLTQQHVICLTPNGIGGGPWGGSGPATDGTHIFVATGNGTYDGTGNYGQSVMKLNMDLTVADWGTPGNYAATNSVDADLASGPLMLIDTNRIAITGKDGCAWNMGGSLGHTLGDTTNPPAGCPAGASQQVWDVQSLTPGVSTGSFDATFCGAHYFVHITGSTIYSFAYSGGTFTTSPAATSAGTFNQVAMTCSSNSGSNSVIWAISVSGGPFSTPRAYTLHAYNPATLAEYWNSGTQGTYSKYAAPTVANGSVYVSTFSGTIDVYSAGPGSALPTQILMGRK